jgi:1-acyl-sn-glycerol-3-phosphate acyltransferase
MSDFTYSLVRGIGYPAFWVSSSPVVLHRDRVPRAGPAILASNHLSHYDVPCLMAASPRHIDFMSVVEFLRKPWVGTLFRAMNCFFLDRGRADPRAVRVAVDRLRAGRLIAMFPEGQIRAWDESVIHGRPFKPGVAKLAYLAGAPIVPCVVLGTGAYRRFAAWLPLRRTRYGVIFGQPLIARTDLDERAALDEFVARLAAAYVSLYRELRAAMPPGFG